MSVILLIQPNRLLTSFRAPYLFGPRDPFSGPVARHPGANGISAEACVPRLVPWALPTAGMFRTVGAEIPENEIVIPEKSTSQRSTVSIRKSRRSPKVAYDRRNADDSFEPTDFPEESRRGRIRGGNGDRNLRRNACAGAGPRLPKVLRGTGFARFDGVNWPLGYARYSSARCDRPGKRD